MGDLHIGLDSADWLRQVLLDINQKADVLALCGDLTDYGEIEQAKLLTGILSDSTLPIVGVLGNHDYDRGQEEKIKQILSSVMTVLDGHSVELNGIGFAGVKGFGGGFGGQMLGFFGEGSIKNFVRESINESLRLETALSQLRSEKKFVLLHYSPVSGTVTGENPEIFPFLGSSRLEEPINMFGVTAVFHGHSHFGTKESSTLKNIPVYNTAYPLLKKLTPSQPYCLLDF